MTFHDPILRRRYRGLRASMLAWLSESHRRDSGNYVHGHVRRLMRLAETLETWDDLESEGVVRMRCEPDSDDNDFDPYPGRGADSRKVRAWEQRMHKLDDMGCWWYCAEYLDEQTGSWEQADSIGCCYGDLDDADYGGDLKRSAIEALYTLRRTRLADAVAAMSARATYAGPAEGGLGQPCDHA